MWGFKQTEIPEISAIETRQLLKEQSALLVDVRTAEEYSSQHIPGSLNIPLDALPALVSARLPDKDAKIILHCQSGRRSAAAAQYLQKAGYTDIYNMGGIISWPYGTVKGK